MTGRVALLIGNSAYQHALALSNPQNDATALGRALEGLGFATTVRTDINCKTMENDLQSFYASAERADAALFFFAGHGIQVDGENYLIPIDSELKSRLHLKRWAFSLTEILGAMEASATNSLLFIDACRDNPFISSYKSGPDASRSLAREGLAELRPSANRSSYIAFATAPNEVAFDGRGDHSPFTRGLLEHVATEGLSISDIMVEVRKSVVQATGSLQIPWDQSSLQERFFFNPTTQPRSQVAEPTSFHNAARKHSVYFSGSWREEHVDLNNAVIGKLTNQYGLVVVGDHKAYGQTKHERGLRYAQRVEEILGTCTGMVVVLPKTCEPQTTAPFIFVELMLASKHQLPVLLLIEDGVALDRRREGEYLSLTFGTPDSEALVPLLDIDLDAANFNVQSLRNTYTIKLSTKGFLNAPHFVSTDMLTKGPTAALASLFEEFTSYFSETEQPDYVFNIIPYAKARERRVIAEAIFEETGLACINGSDAWAGAPYTRTQLREKIGQAWFVISDLSGPSQACIFETGVAVGSKRPTFIVADMPSDDMPFGVDHLPRLRYSNLDDLKTAIRQHCRGYRRRVFNIEVEAKPSI